MRYPPVRQRTHCMRQGLRHPNAIARTANVSFVAAPGIKSGLAACLLLVATCSLAADQTFANETLAVRVPGGAIAYIEVAGLAPVIESIQNSEYLAKALATPQYQTLTQSPQFRKAQAGRQLIETQLGTDLWTAGRKFLGDRWAIGFYPEAGRKDPHLFVLVQVADAQILTDLHTRLAPLLVLAGDGVTSTTTADGTKLIESPGKLSVASRGRWLALSSSRGILDRALELAAGKGDALAAEPAFQALQTNVGPEHLGSLFINTALIAQLRDKRLVPEKADNPLGSLLLWGMAELAARSPYFGLTLDVENHGFVLAATVAGDVSQFDEAHRVFFADPAAKPVAVPQPPQRIGGFALQRNLDGWYRHREALLEANLLPGFDKFEAGIGNLLPGKKFGEDVMPLIGRNFSFVAAPQDFSHLDGTPGVKLPGFAITIELAKPKEGAAMFQLFFQTFSSILNFAAAQQNRQPWLLGLDEYHGVKITSARYLEKPSGERLPLVFNFLPAIAQVGDQLIISSSLGLCKQLIDGLQNPAPAAEAAGQDLVVELDPEPLAAILEANREFFQARLIQNGRAAEQAAGELDAGFALLRGFKPWRLSATAKAQAYEVKLQGGWK